MKIPYNKSIKTYLIGISVIFTLVMTVLVVSVSYYTFNTLLSKSLIQSTSYNLHLASESITGDIMPIISMSRWSETNSQLSKYLEVASMMEDLRAEYLKTPTFDKEAAFKNAKDIVRIQSLTSWKRLQEEYRNNRSSLYIDRIIISSFFGNYLQISPISSYYAGNVFETITSFENFNEQLESADLFWTGLIKNPFSEGDSDYILPVIRPVYATFTNAVSGWSYIAINSQIITDSFKNFDLPSDSHLFITINDHTYQLRDSQFTQIDFEPQTFSALTYDSNKTAEIKDTDGNIYHVVSIKSALNGWIFSQTLSSKQFNDQRKVYYYILIFIGVIVLLLGFSLAFFLNRKINKPLEQLMHRMNQISQGDFSKDPDIEWTNELGTIGQGINQLAENVVVLMDKRIEDEKVKTDLEYQILQSQINPHFLYNTLNSIKWMATIQNATGIAEMTTSLAKLLRSISKDTKQLHPIKEEIKLLDNYFLIQKYRYGGTLQLQYNIESDELLDQIIPKFTLQPIIENAIFHGIEPKGAPGEITVHIYSESSYTLVIDIIDNGIGMTDEQIREVLSPKKENTSDFFNKIGINNVNMRIKHAYGNQYGLSITSVPDEGTTMRLRMIKRTYPQSS